MHCSAASLDTNRFALTSTSGASMQFTICCMNGSAIGGGVGLAAACDKVIAIQGAYVTLSDVKLGIIPSSVKPFLMRALGENNCRRLFCTSEHVNMTSALEMDLRQRIVNDQSEFPAAVKEIANKIQLCDLKLLVHPRQ